MLLGFTSFQKLVGGGAVLVGLRLASTLNFVQVKYFQNISDTGSTPVRSTKDTAGACETTSVVSLMGLSRLRRCDCESMDGHGCCGLRYGTQKFKCQENGKGPHVPGSSGVRDGRCGLTKVRLRGGRSFGAIRTRQQKSGISLYKVFSGLHLTNHLEEQISFS